MSENHPHTFSEQFDGIVVDISYRNEETGFAVVRLQREEDDTVCTCVGSMPAIERGESIRVRGQWQNHKRFGVQFSLAGYELVRPTTIKGITMLLGSGLIPHIGPNRAEKIIETFGQQTLMILDKHPQRLLEVNGIGKKTLKGIIRAWEKQSKIRDLMLFLHDFGIGVSMVTKIYRTYGQQSKEIISRDPYSLIDDIWGIGFKKADAIAQKLGARHDSYRRIKAGIIFLLKEASGNGHVYLPRDHIVESATALLEVNKEKVIYSLDHAAGEKVIINEHDRIYLKEFYYAECAVASTLSRRAKKSPNFGCLPEPVLERWIAGYSAKTGWQGDVRQIEAVKNAIQNPLFLLTGGPGTGKTTTLQVVVSFFRENNIHVVLAAPTGRAAQRMGTISGLKAKTIHRLLEYNPRNTGEKFARNEKNPVKADVVIIDESSMVDLMLMRSFLSALSFQTRLIMVGDSNQLPSVGAGNVLKDMIESGRIPHVRLTTIFRQAAKSRIVTAAHEIIHDIVPKFSNMAEENCFFMSRDDPQASLDTLIEIATRRIPDRYGLNPLKDIQILSPMHKGILGTQNINSIMQNSINLSEDGLTHGSSRFLVGDKVMQIQNNYDTGVFNGDVGFITGKSGDDSLLVDFDGNVLTYDRKNLDELEHAYCISIHKSQGSEFSVIILPLSTQHFVMLQRNLLYTAITRARLLCVLIGSPRALTLAVRNKNAVKRFSHLKQKIMDNICNSL
ncbi:MAG: ATP-dependent RecD-like DNA helicase [Fibrobacterota bacterium]